MNLNELLEMLELGEPAEFEYFENFADIVESDEDIEEDALVELFSETDRDAVADIIGNYFDELLTILDGQYADIGNLLTVIRDVLTALICDESDEGSIMRFAEELEKFRVWYCFDSSVNLYDIAREKESNLPVRDALTQLRLEKLDDVEHNFDFSEAIEYEIDEYLLDLAGSSREYTFEDDGDNVLDHGFVYDDEMKDDQ